MFTSTVRTWPGMRSEYSVLPPHEGETRTKPNQVGIAFSPHRGVVQQWNGVTIETDVAPGTAFVTGSEGIVWTRVREWTEALEIYPDLELLEERAPTVFAIEPSATPADPVLFGIGFILRRAHQDLADLSDIEANTLAHRLADHVLARHGLIRQTGPSRASRLDARALARVGEFIEARLAGPLRLDELAAEVHLSASRFAHAFRRTTGLPPHQYVMLRRIERARLALLESDTPVEAIARELGFSNLSHFRRVFRRVTGAPPSTFRAR